MYRFVFLLLALEATGSLLDRRYSLFQRRQDAESADPNAVSDNGVSSIPAASASDILASIEASIAATATSLPEGATVVTTNGASATVINKGKH
jgi:hypothetical protein